MSPEPYTPASADLRDFPAMLLDVVRLRDSDLALMASGDEFKAAVLLWSAAWHQIPAGSLPDDERLLAGLARVEPKRWPRLRAMALHGWARCSDGRLHHPVVAEKALECWIEKLNARISSGAGNAKRYGYTFDRAPLDADLDEAMRLLHRLNPKSRALQKARRPLRSTNPQPSEPPPAGLPVGVPPGSQGKGTEGNILPVGAHDAPEDPNKEAWRRAKALLSRAGRVSDVQAGKLFGKLLRDHGLEGRDLLPSIVKAETLGTEDPQGYLTSCAKALGQRARTAAMPATDVSAWSEDVWGQALANFYADGAWSAAMGPRPGEPGCRAPASLVLKAANQ